MDETSPHLQRNLIIQRKIEEDSLDFFCSSFKSLESIERGFLSLKSDALVS